MPKGPKRLGEKMSAKYLQLKASKPRQSDIDEVSAFMASADAILSRYMAGEMGEVSAEDVVNTLNRLMIAYYPKFLVNTFTLETLINDCTDKDDKYIEFSDKIAKGLWLLKWFGWAIAIFEFVGLAPWLKHK